MTYKHISESQSEVMQQFTKLAKEKNIIKEESGLERAARLLSKQPRQADLSPSGNLNQDILKLCTGLRAKGLIAEATRVEERFRMTVTAQNYVRMYGTDGETGEALLEFAHPNGSVEMAEAQDKQGVVEDKLEQHKMIKQIVEKEPTGKLASKQMVLAALKVILADDFKVDMDSLNKVKSQAREMQTRFDSLIQKLKSVVTGLDDKNLKVDFNDLRVKEFSQGGWSTPRNWFGSFVRPGTIREMLDKVQKEQDILFGEFADKNTENNVMQSIKDNFEVLQKVIMRIPGQNLSEEWRKQFDNDIGIMVKEGQSIVDMLVGKPGAPAAPEVAPAQPTGEAGKQANPLTGFADWFTKEVLPKEPAIAAKNDPALTAWFEKVKGLVTKINAGQATTMNGDPEENKKKILAILAKRGL